jgi:hypothetical protein
MFLAIVLYLVLVLIRPQDYPQLAELGVPMLPLALLLGVGWTGMGMIQDGRIQYVGIFNDPNDLALLFVMVLPMALYLSSRGGWFGLKRLF